MKYKNTVKDPLILFRSTIKDLEKTRVSFLFVYSGTSLTFIMVPGEVKFTEKGVPESPGPRRSRTSSYYSQSPCWKIQSFHPPTDVGQQ